ncbi:NUDIX hydrolase [Pandoraea pulmonicola]|uniref:ADP-ribose pyrophosphatase n=1 Tax=Pandoraea pulmonicola TaxID=93221 RepID=A0AAJ4ZGC2_PANPU|nr:NUDIX domain-containing protein [Pandoraea pulmonicola]AJC23637.2 ADP-ribose pyrophosphatase [Pandoraea pulmonicola]SUA92775.1 NTP pyrophosphohydrolases containing a Zn-finger, probably nucleic-acid-binding [Pandoraea pulmonicola]
MTNPNQYIDTQFPRIGCGAAIHRDGRILLIRRLRDPEAGCWGLPGGKLDWAETVEDAVRREIREELAIVLGEVRLLCIVDQIDVARHAHWVAPVYEVTEFSGEPRVMEPEKHAAYAWFSRSELPAELTYATRVALDHLPSVR